MDKDLCDCERCREGREAVIDGLRDMSTMTGSAESIATGTGSATEARPAQKLEDQISKAVDSDQYNPGDYPPTVTPTTPPDGTAVSTKRPMRPATPTHDDYCTCLACEAREMRLDTAVRKGFAKKTTKTSRDYLRESISIQNERSVDYDSEDGERSMGKTIIAFNAITGYDLTEPEGWLLLQLLKDTRQWTSPTIHEDSALDCVSYAALKAESLNSGPTTKR